MTEIGITRIKINGTLDESPDSKDVSKNAWNVRNNMLIIGSIDTFKERAKTVQNFFVGRAGDILFDKLSVFRVEGIVKRKKFASVLRGSGL